MPPEDTKDDDSEKPAITFKTEVDFHRELDRKLKPRVKEATDALRAEILGKLGLESLDDIDEKVVSKLKASDGQATEVEALKRVNGKLAKDLEKAGSTIAGHVTKLQGVARRAAKRCREPTPIRTSCGRAAD